jgi:uncharacterized membrane protein
MAGEYVAGGRTVAAGRGWSWIAEGWGLFKKEPGVWIGILVVVLLINIALAFIPVAGKLATFILGPVFGGGILLGCRAMEQGGKLEIGHLFAGFRERFGPLVLVGVLNLVAMAVIVLVVGLITGVSLFTIAAGMPPHSISPAAALTLLLAMLIVAALQLPVVMAVWFAPALVVFHGKDAVAALRESFIGCMRNVVPYLVYGLVMLVFAILASIPVGLGWLVLGPVLAASIYTSYKDIFTAA